MISLILLSLVLSATTTAGNEIICLSNGKHLIILNATEMMARRSTEGNTQILTFVPKDGSIQPACTFQLQGARRKKRGIQGNHKNPTEGLDEVIITQCSASGRQRPVITWDNEENIISREDKVNTTNNITTVTSTLHYYMSSISSDLITCHINHKGDSQTAKHILDELQYSIVTSLVIIFVALFVAVLVLGLVFCFAHYRLRRKQSNKFWQQKEKNQAPRKITAIEDTSLMCDIPKSLFYDPLCPERKSSAQRPQQEYDSK
ncbi:uncharacterized protein LOC142139591 [Mixophyes fleayi]|uniref:uncharacterized protein LOC142139591 n=1 Tax=Mixophyes fleayi TaxID=3061075 RepID=UPI003F4E0A23